MKWPLVYRETIQFAFGDKLLKLTNINLCLNKSCMCRNAFKAKQNGKGKINEVT